MRRGQTARGAALDMLARYRRSGGEISEPVFSLDDPRENALARAIYWGVLQNMALLDFHISCYSTLEAGAMDPALLDVLRTGAYQIEFFDRVPPRAAVYEAVEEARRRVNRGAASMANAVLRRIAENRDSLPEPGGEEELRLSIKYSHPVWLCRKLLRLLGDSCEEMLKADNSPCSLALQANTLRCGRDELARMISQTGTECFLHPWEPGTLELPSGTDPLALEPFIQGLAFVQDPAARAAVSAAGIEPGMEVLDVCAAPGGKTFAAAMDLSGRGRVMAMDISEKRLSRVKAGAARLGLGCVTVRAADARKFDEDLEGTADAVLADVPCSGLGTIRKKPDIRYKDPARLQTLPGIQLDILKNVSRYVKPGGVLLYSTCTVLPEENSGVTEAFTEWSGRFEPEDFTLGAGAVVSKNGETTLWPHVNRCDGFYIKKLRRTK